MNKYIILIITLLILVGCDYSQVTEESKTNYLNHKSELLSQEKFNKKEEIPFDIRFSLDQVSDEEISYRVILDNPEKNITNIKALVVHNYLTEDVFPSIGLFDEPANLLLEADDVKGIVLVGYINTLETIETLDIDVRVLIEYQVEGQDYKIYYKMTK